MIQLHFWSIAQCLFLLAIANGVPVIVKKILGEWLAQPVDGGLVLRDGQPLLGRSKTVRGVLLAIFAATLGGPLVGLGMGTGMLIGVTAMLGDLLSSFIKRRLRLEPSSKAPGLDQIPESMLPFTAVSGLLGLSVWDILVGVGAFWIGELVLSRLLYFARIRDKPY